MPARGPSVCACGIRVPAAQPCRCQRERARIRKARHDLKRPTARQRGYDAEWERESAAYLAAHPVCQRNGCDRASSVVDHVIPHKGNRLLFWTRANWQALCTTCHSSWKQKMERLAAYEARQ